MSRLFASLWSALAAVVLFVVLASRSGSPARPLDIPGYLLPGHPMPSTINCARRAVLGKRYLYCGLLTGTGYITATYDAQQLVITQTSLLLNTVTLGELIVAWGSPAGYTRGNGYIQLFWEAKSAVVLPSLNSARSVSPYIPGIGMPQAFLSVSLQPANRVTSVHYYLDDADLPHALFAWRGFVTVNNMPEGNYFPLSGFRP